MNTEYFKYVVAVAENKNISTAARKLYTTQPTITKHLKKLEDELGVQLFTRGSSSMQITEHGEVFLEFARAYLKMEQEMMQELDRLHNKIQVRIGTTNRGGHYAGKHTPEFLLQNPGIELEYIDYSADECEKLLENEELELAVFTSPVHSGKLEYMPLEEDPLILVVPKSSPLVEGLDIENNSYENPLELEKERFQNPDLLYIRSTVNHSLYFAEQSLYQQLGIEPKHYFRVDYVDTRCTVAENGGGIGLFPVITVENSKRGNQCVYCTIKDMPLYRYVVIVRKKGKVLNPIAEKFWRFMIGRKDSQTN